MCNLSQAVFKEGQSVGYEAGQSAGYEKGTIRTLENLESKGIITTEQASLEAGMTVEEYQNAKKKIVH